MTHVVDFIKLKKSTSQKTRNPMRRKRFRRFRRRGPKKTSTRFFIEMPEKVAKFKIPAVSNPSGDLHMSIYRYERRGISGIIFQIFRHFDEKEHLYDNGTTKKRTSVWLQNGVRMERTVVSGLGFRTCEKTETRNAIRGYV